MSKLSEALDFYDSEIKRKKAGATAAKSSSAAPRYASADNDDTAYQQYAKEYAQYGSQYQRQLVQGKTGRQWAADVNKRLEELQAQQSRYTIGRAMNTASSFLQKLKGTEEPDTLVSEVDAYDKQIARLRKEKEWADYFAAAGLSDEVGYKTGSAAGQVAYKQAQAAKPANPREELEKQREAGEMDLATYQKYYQSTGDNRSAYWKYGTDTAWKEPSDSWTKDELTNFYYLYNESASDAEKYAERVNNKYNAAKAQEKKDEVGERAAKNGWTGVGATLASIPLAMTSLMDTAERAAEYSVRGTVTQKADLTPADIGMAMTSAIASTLNEKSGTINDNVWVIGGKGLGDLYETGVSILNSLASVYMLGGVGTYANFFGQASKTAYEEGIQRGLSVDKALTYGYASGVAEVAGEIFSIEHLIKMKNPSSLKGIIKNIFVQGGIEASEESATTLMNTISDAIINGDKSELASNYYALIQAGYSSEEASQLAISDWTQGIMYDALGGFVSGTVSGTIQSGAQGSMTYAGDAQELIDYAKSEGADTAAAKRAQKYEKRVQSGKRMTNYQAGTLTELAQEAVVSKDLDNIREAVGKRLSALGENSSALTEAVVRQAVQQEAEAADVSVPKVTEKQRGLIQNSKAAKRVLSEMDIGNMRMETAAEVSGHDSSQYQRSNEWARDIGTRIIAPGEYGVRSTNTVTAEEKRADVKVGDESGKVVGFKNGMARVEVTENGKSTIREVKPDDVQQLPKQTRRLFDEISRYDGDTQAAMYAAYMPGQDIEAYVQAADTAMNLYGAQTKATLEQARSFGKATFRMLSDAQLDALMQAGRKLADQRKAAAERIGESKGEVKQGKVSYDGGEADGRRLKAPSKEAIDRMSDAEKALAEALTATGVDVVFYESEANAEGKYSGAQGMYHNGTVYLDVNAGMNSVESGQRTIVLTAAHEMTHFIRENSESGYIALREFITDRLMQQGLDIEELVTQKRARESRKLSYDEAVEEVIADACETVLTEPTAIQQLASDNMPLAKKIRKWLNDFFRKIKSAFAGLEAVHDEAKAMTDYMDELRAMWDDALADAVRNRANKNAAENGDGAARYSLRPVAPVQPTSDTWQRSKTTAEAKRIFPDMWNVAAEKSKKRNPTQIASTVGTYRNIFNILKGQGFDGTILDASSGLGIGTETGRKEFGFKVEDIEPFPGEDYNPMYRDYSALDKQYDAIISSAVLNVLPQDQRDALVSKMGQLLKPGGRMYITTRGKDVDTLAKSGKNIRLGDMEWIETVKGSYQKGFTNPELVAYLRDALGDGFDVVPASKATGGKFNNNTSVVVTKRENSAKYSIREDAPAEIHKAVTDKSYQGDIRLTDTSPSLMLGHKGVRNLPMMMKASHIRENILTKQEAAKLGLNTGKGINYHGLGEEVFKKVIDSLDDISVGYRGTPKANDPSRRENSFLLISTVKDNGGNTIVVPVYINEMGSYNRVLIRTNKIASVYGKSSLNEYIKREVARGNLVRIKKRSPAISESSAPIAVDYNGVTSQAKAADQTAMAFGNTSIRSSSENSNTKIKKSERDAEYLSAVRRGDLETARSMVNEAAEDAEYDITAYHVSMNGAFNVFDRNRLGENTVDYADDAATAATAYLGFWFSDHDASKPTRSYGMIPGDARQFRLKAEALYPIALQTLQDELLNEYISEDAIEQYSAGEYSAIREAAEEYAAELQRMGYSGLKVQDSELGGTSYVVFDPEQIKSADAVVYDDNGKVIPLSERFNSKSRDIRYSNRDVDLTAKYPQLNLNEDISELDGVPAIELTDGSVLPITERDGRYPTHVSFIEANRIDVDDLKSGGWIGNGVYDPSFTSDTQRYIERQQARKRVAELTGKPYEQFRYSMRDDAMTDRELLARALDSVAATESERKLLAQYRTEFDRYQELYDKLDDAQIEYSAARRAVDDAYAQAKRSRLTAEERRRTEGAWRERIGALKATQQETREARDKLLKEVDAQDRKLLKLRAMNPVKDMLSRARADMRETIKARQDKTDTRAKVRDMAKKLSDLLLKESKDKHVLLELQKPVAEVLDMLNLDTVNAAERVAKYDAAIAKTTDPEMKRELAETRDRIQAQGDRLKTRLDALHTAYQAIANSADPTVANGYDENIAAKMQEVSQLVGDTPLAKMTQEQLDAVHDLLKMTYTVVSKANKAFVLNQKAGIEESAQAEIDRLSATEGADLGLKPVQFAKRQFWSMLKPGEIFHRVGGELERAYNEVRKGEDVRARDVVTARSFFQQAAEKHGYFSWALEEKHDFVSAQGRPFSLSLDDMMSVYATSRREQGKKHLEAGGIVFGKNGKIKVKKKGVTLTMSQIKARAYTLDEQVLDEIIGKLTPEQKAFVEEMENWLSTKPAEWGNEVSRELYGINLFKEKVYWPIKSASEYLQSRSGDSDNVKIKNSGFTRSTVEKANNPIYIGGFVDTWSQHVYEMATYHGFTLPLEDFTRIFNYATSASDIENGANSVKAMLTNAFGSEAPVQQIELLLKDVNGSARSDPTAELMNKGLAFMKKYAVAGSLSVAIQQPSAIARATAYIDPKYFVGEKITAEKHKELWEHMKKYAPVAAIKEIGYFDQGLGRSAREWMTAREYDGLAEKAKGLVTDSNYRSDVIMALPGLMDELTWCSIWQAAEREVADTTNLKTGSEEFNKRVGDRFTQIITETQVYDSVFSRSAMMRSKDVGVKMATAFMAEPLTNVSMVVDAIDDFRNGRTALGARKLGSVVASMLLNSILVSFVYAARNDDDDKSYIEKYIAALTGELKDGFNPLTYIPYIKDVVSIVQGYDVERNDMTMIADLWNAYTSLKSDKKSTYRKIEDFAGRIAQIFGLPLKNVMRDMRAAYYTYDTIANGEETTWKGALQAIAEGWTGESPSNSEQLYDALVSGNAKQADRVKARFEDESAAQAAVKKVIREKFAPTDGGKQSIDKQTAIKQLQDYAGMSKQEAEKQVAKWTVSLAYGFEYGDTKDEYLNGNITIDKAKRVLMGAGATDMEADAKTLQWKFEKDTGIAYDDMSDAYVSGDISRSDAVNYLVKYGKTYRTDAEATVQQWQCEKDTGFKYSELKDLYVAGTISADRAAALRSKYGGTSEDDAKSTVLQWQCVKDTGIEYSDIRKAYEEKRVSGEAVENMLMKYGGKSKDDATARREKYDFTIANPGTEDISDAAVQKYNESVAAAGISGKDYYTSWQMYNRTESDYDENGKPISYSKLYKIAAYIDSLNLTNAQKDAMFCAFYTARNLRRTPWH